jgi:prophage regulatory protein
MADTDDTPATRTLRMKDLPDKVGLRPSTIYALVAQGRFPAPFKLLPGGRAVGWLEATIDDWLDTQIERQKSEVNQ